MRSIVLSQPYLICNGRSYGTSCRLSVRHRTSKRMYCD